MPKFHCPLPRCLVAWALGAVLMLAGHRVRAQAATGDAWSNAATSLATSLVADIDASSSPQLRVAISGFTSLRAGPCPLGISMADALAAPLFRTHRVDLVERSQLQRVLREQQLSESDLFDPRSAAAIGGVLGAKAIIVGRLLPTARGVIIRARLVDAESGKVLAVAGVELARDIALEHGVCAGALERNVAEDPVPLNRARLDVRVEDGSPWTLWKGAERVCRAPCIAYTLPGDDYVLQSDASSSRRLTFTVPSTAAGQDLKGEVLPERGATFTAAVATIATGLVTVGGAVLAGAGDTRKCSFGQKDANGDYPAQVPGECGTAPPPPGYAGGGTNTGASAEQNKALGTLLMAGGGATAIVSAVWWIWSRSSDSVSLDLETPPQRFGSVRWSLGLGYVGGKVLTGNAR